MLTLMKIKLHFNIFIPITGTGTLLFNTFMPNYLSFGGVVSFLLALFQAAIECKSSPVPDPKHCTKEHLLSSNYVRIIFNVGFLFAEPLNTC
jgi:hypothetical protein